MVADKVNFDSGLNMATGSNKIPPTLSKYKTYDDWIKALSIWVKFTDLEKKQGPAVFLSLEGEAQEAVLELDEALITSDDGVKHITKRLDGLFKKDELLKKYEALKLLKVINVPVVLQCRNF